MSFIIVSVDQLSENVKRIVFSDELKIISKSDESGYVKLQFTDSEGVAKMRTYTIRDVDEDRNLVTIDFIKHQGGVAYPWIEQAKVGDSISVKGPGASKLVDTALDWFILMGDLTALPAIAVNLRVMPENAKGYAIIEVRDESDIQPLAKPDGIELDWVINADLNKSEGFMLQTIKQKLWLDGEPYIWVAGEFSSARALRQYFREEKGITQNRYFSSYWKIGESDEGNKKAKKQDGGF